MKKKKLIYLIAGLVILAVVIYLYIKYRQSKPFIPSTPEENAKTSTDLGGTSTPTATDSFPLKFGSKGLRVKRLQTWINEQANLMQAKNLGYVPNIPLAIDGVFGSKTDAALKAISKAQTWQGTYLKASDIYPATEAFYQAYVGSAIQLIEADLTNSLFGGYSPFNPINLYK